ncbi:hypothetical protein [Hyalangium rubrum]|uniref:Lipoprotein n=1 Tax=Hyalangium rubrum TaxID=3103134 RepID=A0ABU5H722_9BACT|nr:hypothetical protein [Hyalangium sp. s54d21]MDY7229281.1 hypothetical protein [Hyalangium sp. s54d21]
MRRLMGLLVFTCVVTGCKSREEKLQAAEDQGNMLVSTKARIVKGVGEALKTEGKEAAQVVTEGSGEVVKAVGVGFDKGISQVKLAVHQELGPKGLGATRATRAEAAAARHSITVYVTMDQAYTGPLELRAYDAANLEIGRSKVQMDEKSSTAKYVDFEFDPRTPLLTVDHFELR